MSTFAGKLGISVFPAVLFFIINMPQLYELTGKVFNTKFIKGNCRTSVGIVLHTLVFMVILYFMGGSKISSGIKLKHSLTGTFLFFLINSPTIYSITGKIFGPSISNQGGCPTLNGIIFHSVVYLLFLVLIMYLPDEYD